MNRAARREAGQIVAGAVLLVVLFVFIAWVFSGAAVARDDRYEVTARFTRADGLSVGSTVQAAGVPVGTIAALDLDGDFRAVAVLSIDNAVELDTDASASIVTDGLFGGKFVSLDIGAGDDFIAPGGEIVFTQEAMVIEDLFQLIIAQGRERVGASAPQQ